MIRIREASTSDLDQIVGFQLNMAMETESLLLDKLVVEKGVSAVFEDHTKGTYFVADSNGMVVGSLLTTYEWSDWRNGRVLWIQSVYVLPDYRGQGIYKKLYKHIKSLVKSHELDFRGIRLYVDKTNENAQKVYEKLGMENHHYELYEWMNDQ